MTHDEIKARIKRSWREADPRFMRTLPAAFLEEQADALASLAEGEMAALMPPLSRAEAWSEVARDFLGQVPRPEARPED